MANCLGSCTVVALALASISLPEIPRNIDLPANMNGPGVTAKSALLMPTVLPILHSPIDVARDLDIWMLTT